MLTFCVWALAAGLFWDGCLPPPDPPRPGRRLWWLRDGPRWRLFESLPAAHDRQRAWLVERAHPAAPATARVLSRPVLRLFLADLDGRGGPELLALVLRRFAQGWRRRLYVYAADARHLRARWLGSRLAFVLADVAPLPGPGPGRLRSREWHAGRVYHGLYRWDGFGFRTLSMTVQEDGDDPRRREATFDPALLAAVGGDAPGPAGGCLH